MARCFSFLITILIILIISPLYADSVLEFAKKGNDFRIIVTPYEGKGFTFFENRELGLVLIDLIDQTQNEIKFYPLENDIVSNASVTQHPVIRNVTRIELKLKSSILESIEVYGKSIHVILKKSDEIVLGNGIIETSIVNKGTEILNVDEYRIGANDTLDIEVFGFSELSFSKKIPSDGTLSYPYVGDINVIGMTTNELRGLIKNKLEDGYLVNPAVTVTVSDYKSQWAYVTGNVSKPGMFYLKGPTTLIELLSEVGGTDWHLLYLTKGAGEDSSNPDKIEIRKTDLYDNGSFESNIIIEHSDRIEIPKNYYYVSGEVNSPGSFDYTETITIYKAITEAGGITGWGDPKKVELMRTGNESSKKTVFNL